MIRALSALVGHRISLQSDKASSTRGQGAPNKSTRFWMGGSIVDYDEADRKHEVSFDNKQITWVDLRCVLEWSLSCYRLWATVNVLCV